MTLEMRPATEVHDPADCVLSDSVFSGQRPLQDVAKSVARADVGYLLTCQRSTPIAFALSAPSLLGHVVHVLTVAAQKQVVRIDAAWDVATVANLHSFRNVATDQFPCDTVRPAHAPITQIRLPVAAAQEHTCLPKPAGAESRGGSEDRAVLVDERPELGFRPARSAFGYAVARRTAVLDLAESGASGPDGKLMAANAAGTLNAHARSPLVCHAPGRSNVAGALCCSDYTRDEVLE